VPWVLTSPDAPLTDFKPAIALTLVRQPSPGNYEILCGVRTPEANRTHPEVLSVPTMRIPRPVAQRWLEVRSGEIADEYGETEGEVLREVTNLLARKLGVADALELGRITLRHHAIDGWKGTSVNGEHEDGSLDTENITMFNACVEVVDGGDFFPERTAAYDPLVWTPVSTFCEMVRTREVGLVRSDLDAMMYCVYGLCLQTSTKILEQVTLD
jgi:hypothetical protein